MKMHSYAYNLPIVIFSISSNLRRFYNGHLSETRRRLQALDKPETASKKAAVRYPSPQNPLQELQANSDSDNSGSSTSQSIRHLRDDLALELTSPLGNVTYPDNLTVYNFADFLFCPTLCYELEYPRTERIVWKELFYKSLAVFGCIFLLTITSEEFILPVLAESDTAMHSTTRLSELALILAETVSRLLFPFMVSFLLVFLVIFEYICGAFAEITCKSPVHSTF
jgi:sterol O-acyltransferase